MSKKQAKMRNKLLRDLKVLLSTCANASAGEIDNLTAKAENLLHALEDTYMRPASDIPRLGLPEPYFALGGIYSKWDKMDKAVLMILKGLSSIGFVFRNADLSALSEEEEFEVVKWGLCVPGVVEAWAFLCDAYAVLAPRDLQRVRDAAMLVHRIWVGEDGTFGGF